jgi:hypothetical protein
MSGLQYCVFHISKYKEIGRIGSHIDRNNLQQTVERIEWIDGSLLDDNLRELLGSHIDHSRSHLNEELSPLKSGNLSRDIETRIHVGYTGSKAIRHDAVRGLGVMLTGSHERMKEIESDPALFESWKKANYEFACREFGSENIVRFTLHRDEKTPHIHCVFVPITKDGHLSAKSFMNDRGAMRSYQDRYAKAMGKFGLERGIEQNLTGNKYDLIKEFKRSSVVQEREVIQSVKKGIKEPNILNFKRLHKEVVDKLCDYALEAEKQKRKAVETELTYSNTIKDNISSDLERVKREVNLIQHAVSMGYKVNEHKSSKLWMVMDKSEDKILIKNGVNNNGHWTYKSLVDDSERGTIVDFMLKRGFSYKDIRSLSSLHLDDSVIKKQASLSPDLSDLSVQHSLAQEYFSDIKEKLSDNYLTARGIDNETYAHYLGSNLKVGSKAVFGLYQGLDSNGCGTMCSTISYLFSLDGSGNPESKKYFQKGLSRGLSVLKDPNVAVSKIVVTESPIDALSHKQMNKEPSSTMYLSTCGNISKSIEQELSNVLKGVKSNNQEVVFAFDNDKGGSKLLVSVQGIAKEQGIKSVSIAPTKSKDWNQQLQSNIGKETLNFISRLQMAMAKDMQMQEDMDHKGDVRKKLYKDFDLDVSF